MKLTKKLEAEILKVYNTYWESYLKGEVKTMAFLLADEYMQVGSAESEVFFNKRDAVKFLHDTIDQVAGKLQMRKRNIKLEQQNSLILVHELCDVYALADKSWIFYAKFRASTLMQKKRGKWKIIHQHTSFPDIRTDGGENIAIQKIADENLQLREAVKRRTIELEHKNRELEIETALEKVRAIAMSMKESADMLTVCKTISLELQSLGVKEIRNVQTAIFYETRGTYMNYEYYTKHKKTVTTETNYTNHKIHKAFAKKMMQGKGEFFSTLIKGEKVKDWIAYQRSTNVFIDRFLEKASSLNYYWHSLGPVALGISTYMPLSKDDLGLFNRFLNVFELAYTRYLDIEQALAQAREAKIETSLEKVRAQAMSMMKSDELLKVCESVFKELRMLGFNETDLRNTQIIINNDDKRTYSAYQYSDYIGGEIAEVPYDLHPVIRLLNDKLRQAKDAFADIEISGAALKDWKKFVNSFPQKHDEKLNAAKELHYYFYSVGIGALGISSFKTLTEEKLNILQRLRNVFNLSYQRYTDIAQAEAQTREAQIELGLERVRARAMAMQNSDELKELIGTVFTELTKLDLALTRCIIWVFEPATNAARWWMANSEEPSNPMSFYIKYHKHPAYLTFVQEWKKQNVKFVYDLVGADKIAWDDILFNETELKQLPDVVKDGMRAPERVLLSASFNNFGGINVASLAPLSDEHFDLLLRFAKVFDLTYTRFLDLQKAEAQTREAQIELGLERVRARAMAMQNSDELSELVDTVFKELTKLDFALNWCIINIIDAPSLTNMVWAANPETNKPPESYLMKFEDYPFHHSMMKGYQERKTKHVYVIEGNEKKTYDDYLFNKTEWRRVPKAAQAASRAMKRYVATFTFSNFGGLQTVGEEYLSEENLDILSRFGKVFDLTYTRFNDLQKAEAQAREAQIEAALERVRSRSMGMQKSEVLQEVIKLVYQQLIHLNINLDHAGFVVDYTPKGDWHFWIADQQDIPSKITHPYFDSVWANQFNEAKEKGADFFVTNLNFEEKNKFYNELLSYVPGLPEASKDFYLSCPGLAATTVVLDNIGLYIENFSGIPYKDEENAILMRFGKVFQQTYTRFLDLQKAETQARESQIEAALERVRSRSLAMHKSEELSELVAVLYEKMNELGVSSDGININVIKEGAKDFESWLAAPGQSYAVCFHVPYFNHPVIVEIIDAIQTKKELLTKVYSFEEKTSFFNYLYNNTDFRYLPEDRKKLVLESKNWEVSIAFAKNTALSLHSYSGKVFSDSENEILKRFAKVFEQSYTRFLDLQKAEAQTREAKIEASLERVRSKAMAMHSSEDLALTVDAFFSELRSLQVTPRRCGVTLIDEETRVADLTVTTATRQNESKKLIGKLKLAGHRVLDGVYDNWKLQKEYHPVLQGAEIKQYYRVMDPQVEFPDFASDEIQYGHYFFFKEGGVFAWTDTKLAEDELKIFRRFTSVLSLTYKRYKDLQQAEKLAQQAEQDLVKLKEEKKKTEDALTELKATQTQLIQSEKMASLGELTAGIAHEIQNPLNFVNNFSEVSSELIKEMVDEVEKGNTEEVKAIANDVVQNLEKINHHGKRAADIVKGMLQHSRSSSGTKEPTNINALADEYLRLAYHGLRAKDKSFNATMKTDFDESIGNINIIPQDIGRVILNLITNAFYVVAEKKKSGITDYEPTVSVSTKMVMDKSDSYRIGIKVTDNGNGIPQKVLDKIFQPFFTTKPTGQGTGLGLSLSYDIVKAHGGEIKVKTEESTGTEFSIILPA